MRTIILSDGRKVQAPDAPQNPPVVSHTIRPDRKLPFNRWFTMLRLRKLDALECPISKVYYL